ncbi:hypothetical protein FJ250_13095 [bacterium]|nr:hypothetical protein [bacterium]
MSSRVRHARAACLLVAALPLLLWACGDTSTEPLTYGTVIIDAQPDAARASWRLAGPGGTSRDGTGDATLADMRTGSYTVTWGGASGYDAPAAATRSLGEGQTITFAGAYAVSGMIFPDTPDKLMTNFVAMYTSLNAAALAPLLHPQYVMYLQQSTYAEFPTVGTTLDTAEEQRIHERMFSGSDVTDPEGNLVPGIEEITFQTFERQGAWATSLPADPIPGTMYGLFDVVILADRGSGHSVLKAQGSLKVYVAPMDTVVAGETRTCYRMRGLVDWTGDIKASETENWGSIKALFR